MSKTADPLAFISDRALFGEPVDEPHFVTAYRLAYELLRECGARATVPQLISLAHA